MTIYSNNIARVLVIGYVWPEPNSSAAGSRMLQLVRLFADRHLQVVFASAAALSEHRYDLGRLGVEEKAIALNDSSFDDYVRAYQPDLVLFDRFFTEEQFSWRVAEACPGALRVLNTEDMHSLRQVRHTLLRREQKQMAAGQAMSERERQSVIPVLANPSELYQAMLDEEITQRELAAILRSDLSLMISEYEIALLQDQFGVAPDLLCYCPFLDAAPARIESELPTFDERKHFVVIGNFRHQPNWDAVLWLKYQLWPLIRVQLPAAELHIYGAYPPPKAMQLHSAKEGFLIKGWTQSAFNVVQQARVCLAPLRFGAGIKGKLMDAMRCGTPSVTTAIGAEGMHGALPWGGAVCNYPHEFAAAAVNLYTHQADWLAAQHCGFDILRDHFAREFYDHLLWMRLQELQEDLVAARKRNFVGQMLRHHLCQSARYMGMWIEAKNRLSQ